jgi:hypothetical protein
VVCGRSEFTTPSSTKFYETAPMGFAAALLFRRCLVELADPTLRPCSGLFRKEHATDTVHPPGRESDRLPQEHITKAQLSPCFQSLASFSQIVDHLDEHAPRSRLSGFIQDFC